MNPEGFSDAPRRAAQRRVRAGRKKARFLENGRAREQPSVRFGGQITRSRERTEAYELLVKTMIKRRDPCTIHPPGDIFIDTVPN